MRKGPQNRIVGLPVWRTAFALVRPGSRGRRALTTFGVLLLGGIAFVFGRSIKPAESGRADPPLQPRSTTGVPSGLYDQNMEGRVVAYINDNEAIYRTELAEYLIARFGMERQEFFVNRIIIDRSLQGEGDLHHRRPDRRPSSARTAEEHRRRSHGRDLPEGNPVALPQDDLRVEGRRHPPQADARRPVPADDRPDRGRPRAGHRRPASTSVQCRMILCRDKNEAMAKWLKITNSADAEKEFYEEASHQGDARMASVKGEIPPIHMHFGDKRTSSARRSVSSRTR